MRKLGVMFLLLLAQAVMAATVAHLYDVNMPVEGRGQAARNQAIQQAFQTVLVRISGDSTILSNDAVKSAISNPAQYLKEYAYTQKQQQLYIQLKFSRAALKALLMAANEPLWGSNRPAVLVWVVEKTEAGIQILPTGNSGPWISALNQQSMRRGLPLVYPLLDITDMQAVSALGLWQDNTQMIQSASARYVPDATLLLRIDATDPQGLQTQWQLLQGDTTKTWQFSGATPETVVVAGVDAVTDQLAQSYAIKASGFSPSKANVVLQVKGVRNLVSYRKILRYLASLTAVKGVSIWSASNQQINFLVSLHGDVGALIKEISLGRTLILMQPGQKQSDNMLMYQLAG